jgi:hypothetical protein
MTKSVSHAINAPDVRINIHHLISNHLSLIVLVDFQKFVDNIDYIIILPSIIFISLTRFIIF